MSGTSPVRSIRAAFMFLTRIPVGGSDYTSEDWRWANAHFPLVGAVVGILSAWVWWFAQPLGAWPAAILALSTSILVTGAFHEDGLADSADALFGGLEPKERVLEILKDSRLGTYGVTALVLSILLRLSLNVSLGASAGIAIVLMHTCGRTPSVVLKSIMPYATTDAAAKSRLLEGSTRPQAIVAFLWTGVIAFATSASIGQLALIALVLTVLTAYLGYRFKARVGGVTGDFLGATEQVGEIATLIVLAGTGGVA